MTSPRKIKANRANAQASTGPKTAPGKARAALNARRHGLSLSVFADPTQSEQVEALAREIAGEPSNDDIYQLARRVAEAQIDLQRVRYARHQFLSDRLANPNYYSLARVREQFALIRQLLGPHPPEIPLDVLSKDLDTTPLHGPRKFAAILSDKAERLRAWTVTKGGHYRAGSLPFAHSILRKPRAHHRIARWIIKNIILFEQFWQNEPKISNVFKRP